MDFGKIKLLELVQNIFNGVCVDLCVSAESRKTLADE